MEIETTVSLVFGGRCFERVYEMLRHRAHIEEDLDVYVSESGPADGDGGGAYRYRELKRSVGGGGGDATTSWDRKITHRCLESQVPYVDPACGRVVFLTVTHKWSSEEQLTEEIWSRDVREDHTTHTACRRASNKHRLAFPPESFADLFGGAVPEFTRLSIGEYTTYAGTLEARTKCNPVYYLEIENERGARVALEHRMSRLVETLLTILPYEFVADTHRRDASAAVQRERVDCVFDEFKRRFVNYHRYRDELWASATDDAPTTQAGDGAPTSAVDRDASPIRLFIMPKWDGTKAVANYCDGFLFVRDACGSLSTYRADLPFDNDLILQLELLGDASSAGERLIVVTEILAVVVKSHDTLYHTYNRNNALHDTGRDAGNVSTSIALKTQFADPNDVCNVYRLVAPLYSMFVLHCLSAERWSRVVSSSPTSGDGDPTAALAPTPPPSPPTAAAALTSCAGTAENTYMRSDRPELLITTVVMTGVKSGVRRVLALLDRFHNYRGGVRSAPTGARGDRSDRTRCIRRLSEYLPEPLLRDRRFTRHSEGLLVAFVRGGSDGGGCFRAKEPAATDRWQRGRTRLPDHGYLKIKRVDTVDLEYYVSLGLATTASRKHSFRVRGVPATFPGWAERPCPVVDDRLIIECYFDRDARCLVFFKDRPDKCRADSDEKISATDSQIIETCAVRDSDDVAASQSAVELN